MFERLELARRLLDEIASVPGDRPLPVAHVVDAYRSAGTELWGKERLVASLFEWGRASGELAPRLIVFEASRLADDVRASGGEVVVLEDRHRRLPWRSLPALARALGECPRAIVHTHGYKANLLGRLARQCGVPMRGLVASAHGWPDETLATRCYNALDRSTAPLGDVTTVAASGMARRFPPAAKVVFLANALPDAALPSPAERGSARASLGFPEDRLTIGYLGRTTAAKGLDTYLACARSFAREPYLWAVAGAGELDGALAAEALPSVRHVGYLRESERFVRALDVFVQASRSEGLSLALLEAMRAGLAIVATDVGSTSYAVRDGIEGVLVPPGDVAALRAAIGALAVDGARRARLGAAARSRFVDEFRIERLQRDVLALYRAVDRGP